MTQVNRIIYNSIPEDWAFDPVKGAFIRDLLDIIHQLKVRTGGNADVSSQDADILALAAVQARPASIFIERPHRPVDLSIIELQTAALCGMEAKIQALSQRIDDLEKQCLSQ
jgi:hypothetical protein